MRGPRTWFSQRHSLRTEILTVVAITATANHWWLDGIVATAILFAAWGIDRMARTGKAEHTEVDRSRRYSRANLNAIVLAQEMANEAVVSELRSAITPA